MRDNGYYHVKIKNKWTIIECLNNQWFYVGTKRIIGAWTVDEIGEKVERSVWRTDTPPNDADIILKMEIKGKPFKFMGRYKNGVYYDDLMHPVTGLCSGWILVPE